MSSRKKRKKRKSRETKRSGATFQKREVSDPIGYLTAKESPSAKSGHPKEISLLISKGKVKKAVNMAKHYHKNLGTEESEAILVEAYVARILEMTEKDLTIEAETLLDLVRERYHLPDQRLAEINAATAAREGINDEDKEEAIDLNEQIESALTSEDYEISAGACEELKELLFFVEGK